MIDLSDKDRKALEEIANLISEYRKEYIESIAESVVDECNKISEEFDPALGRGRGPWWAR